jgi:flavin-dependent dehydrogenase
MSGKKQGENMETHSKDRYDLIIIGAGPAGLTAGIFAARNNISALVLEKGAVPGPMPRGEGVQRYPLLEELLGSDFFETDCHRMDGSLVFRSPRNAARARVQGKKDIYFFEWRRFMDRLAEEADRAGVELCCNSRVLGPVEDKAHTCTGVMYRTEDGTVHKVRGRAVLACDGHNSLIGKHYGVDYDALNCIMVKCIVNNANIDPDRHPELQFHLIANGDLIYDPNFPPSVAYAFPLGGKRMELGLMLRMIQAERMSHTVRNPGRESVFSAWKRIKKEYPGFKEYFNGADIEYEYVTALSNARMVKEFIPVNGVVLIGDSAGFIDPFGSSGIYSGMAMARFWVDLLAGEIAVLPTDGGEADEGLWHPRKRAAYIKAFKKTSVYRRIKRSYGMIGKFEWYVFKHLRTADRINQRWSVITWLLNKVT